MNITLPCPAKLNLFLHILGKRPDGYHELQTVFQLLDYGDDISITSTNDGTITLGQDIPGLAKEDNLIYKAAQLLKPYAKTDAGAQLHLTKRLPMGGGIGGGSSNAASTLLGLNSLWDTQLSIGQLADLGRQLGADVPVFVKGNTAWAEGVGDILEPISIPEKYYLVIAPDCNVSTLQIFSHKSLTRGTLAIKVAAFLERGGNNDCQALVESLFPQVRDAVEWLSQHSSTQLTGTGACIFASFTSKEEAEAVFTLKPKYLKGFIAKGVNKSPLHQCFL